MIRMGKVRTMRVCTYHQSSLVVTWMLLTKKEGPAGLYESCFCVESSLSPPSVNCLTGRDTGYTAFSLLWVQCVAGVRHRVEFISMYDLTKMRVEGNVEYNFYTINEAGQPLVKSPRGYKPLPTIQYTLNRSRTQFSCVFDVIAGQNVALFVTTLTYQ